MVAAAEYYYTNEQVSVYDSEQIYELRQTNNLYTVFSKLSEDNPTAVIT